MLTRNPQPDANPKASSGPVDRVVERSFGKRDGQLLIAGHTASELLERFGSPLFVYDRSVILRKIAEIRSTLTDRFSLYYSMKANPNAAVLNCFVQQGCGIEIASGGELYQALAAGCPPEHIIFAGPAKSEQDLTAALDATIGEIHVESIEEARCIDRLAAEHGRPAKVSLRVNPVDAAGGAMRMGGTASPFGFDEEHLDEVLDELIALDGLRITGVHLFMGTQILDADVLIGQYRRAIDIARHVASRTGPLGCIDFGGGWGTPIFAHEREPDLQTVAAGIRDIDRLMSGDPLLKDARAIVEPGRFLVNEAGVYLSKVVRTKHSRGKVFAVIDGGMHHHLAASGNLGQAIKRNYPLAAADRLDAQTTQATEIVGPLCTPLDTLGRSVDLPPLEAGEPIAVFMSGAYARTASPLGFLSHDAPAEVMVDNGTAVLVRHRGRVEDYLRDQPGAEG